MDRDREAFEAHIRGLLPHAKFNRDDSGEYIAVMVNARWMGWQAALAYVRGERAEARMEDEVQRLHEIADGAHGHNAAVRGAARDRLRTLNVSPPEQD